MGVSIDGKQIFLKNKSRMKLGLEIQRTLGTRGDFIFSDTVVSGTLATFNGSGSDGINKRNSRERASEKSRDPEACSQISAGAKDLCRRRVGNGGAV